MALHDDSALIDRLGGTSVLAKTLFPHNQYGAQRVQNWRTRGIPARVRLDHPELFAVTRDPPAILDSESGALIPSIAREENSHAA